MSHINTLLKLIKQAFIAAISLVKDIAGIEPKPKPQPKPKPKPKKQPPPPPAPKKVPAEPKKVPVKPKKDPVPAEPKATELLESEIEFYPASPTEFDRLSAYVPDGATNLKWQWTNIDHQNWQDENNREGHNTNTLVNLKGAIYRQAAFRITWELKGKKYYSQPVKVGLNDLGRKRPLLVILPPNPGDIRATWPDRDRYIDIRLKYGFQLRQQDDWNKIEIPDFIWKYHPHDYKANSDKKLRLHTWSDPVLIDLWDFRDYCRAIIKVKWKGIPNSKLGPTVFDSTEGMRWNIGQECYFLGVEYNSKDLTFMKDCEKLVLDSNYNEGIMFVRKPLDPKDQYPDPWSVELMEHDLLLGLPYFTKINIERD